MSFKKIKKYALVILFSILFIYFILLLLGLLRADTVVAGINQHCGFYTEQNELITPCVCLGLRTKGEIFVNDIGNNRAYCHGVMGVIFLP